METSSKMLDQKLTFFKLSCQRKKLSYGYPYPKKGVLAIYHKVLVTHYKVLATHHKILVTHYKVLVTNYSSIIKSSHPLEVLVIHHKVLVRFGSPTIWFWSPTIRF